MDEDILESETDDECFREDKFLLDNANRSIRGHGISSDEEVYKFNESDSDKYSEGEDVEEGEDEIAMESDLEDEEKPPDERAWGKRKRSFYNTDFVDQDYEGIYQGEEAEIAELEEQEAKNIQKRLIEQLNDADFSISEEANIAEAAEATEKEEVIESDLSKLTKQQKLDLLKKESPEFFVLVDDFKDKMAEAQKIYPVISYYKNHAQKHVPGVQFLQTKLSLILNYCTNISYYLFLKAKRISVKNHPIMKGLFKYRELLEQLEEPSKKIEPELKKILEMLKTNKEVLKEEDPIEKKEKKKLKLLQKRKKRKEKKLLMKREKESENVAEDVEMEDVEEKEEKEEEKEMSSIKSTAEKRAITYEMAKNKGLIPKRSKVQRNPRVKHRRKYEKAKIRRKGQVRIPRSEIPVYGGEATGIKIGLSKSIKLK